MLKSKLPKELVPYKICQSLVALEFWCVLEVNSVLLEPYTVEPRQEGHSSDPVWFAVVLTAHIIHNTLTYEYVLAVL